MHGSCFCIHSASVCLLVGALNPFPFEVNIDMYVPIAILFFGEGHGNPLQYSCLENPVDRGA